MAATLTSRRLFRGSKSNIVVFPVEDSSVTTGAGLTNLVFNTASLTCYYSVDGAAPVVVNLVTATVGTYTSSGFKQIDATNFAGYYELGIPNAAVASGQQVDIQLLGATNMSPARISIDLISINEQAGPSGGKQY